MCKYLHKFFVMYMNFFHTPLLPLIQPRHRDGTILRCRGFSLVFGQSPKTPHKTHKAFVKPFFGLDIELTH